MAKIGYLTEVKPDDIFDGEINTLAHSIKFQLVRVRDSSNPRLPAYEIRAWNADGVEVPIGSAWEKQMRRHGREGETFLSLSFTDPSFGKPLNVAAFKAEKPREWTISFRHRVEKAA